LKDLLLPLSKTLLVEQTEDYNKHKLYIHPEKECSLIAHNYSSSKMPYEIQIAIKMLKIVEISFLTQSKTLLSEQIEKSSISRSHTF
jgi:hypothetical protein